MSLIQKNIVKKGYATPALKRIGSIEEITQATGDGNTMDMFYTSPKAGTFSIGGTLVS